MMSLRHIARGSAAAAAATRRPPGTVARSLILRISCRPAVGAAGPPLSPRLRAAARFLGSGTGGDGGDGDDEDPFGLRHRDSPDPGRTGNVGADLPPSYVRDPTTGKFTGEVEAELTPEERELLEMTSAERERLLAERFVSGWNDAGVDSTGESSRKGEVAARIREKEMALNVLGRKPSSVAGSLDGGDDREDGLDKALSDDEFDTFKSYLQREHGLEKIKDEDVSIPTQRKLGSGPGEKLAGVSADPDLDLTWMSSKARTDMGDESVEDPFIDLLPSDLNPARKVNRRQAKRIPQSLLHHNNLSLLRRYVTPGGQIMNRVQSRLGARDQRKIAKLVKRARHLGLIPYFGQWKYEDHGNVHAGDIKEDRDWEKELIRRGLITRGKRENEEGGSKDE